MYFLALLPKKITKFWNQIEFSTKLLMFIWKIYQSPESYTHALLVMLVGPRCRHFRPPGRLLRAPGRIFRARPGRFSGHDGADIWTQGAQYYEHIYACSRWTGGPWEATRVLLNSSKQGPSTVKQLNIKIKIKINYGGGPLILNQILKHLTQPSFWITSFAWLRCFVSKGVFYVAFPYYSNTWKALNSPSWSQQRLIGETNHQFIKCFWYFFFNNTVKYLFQ